MTVRFNTHLYVSTHGRTPRGYGMWGFYFGREKAPWFTHGSFAHAKEAARAEAKRRGCAVVVVAP